MEGSHSLLADQVMTLLGLEPNHMVLKVLTDGALGSIGNDDGHGHIS